jgi:hypothetical protein
MAPSPVPSPSVASVIDARRLRLSRLARIAMVAAPHLGALALMLATESDVVSRTAFILSWGLVNAFWLAVLRRPALSGLISFVQISLLVALSLFKYDVLQMTASFVDLMIVDVDALMFLFALFPDLRWQMAVALLVGVAIATVFWRFDPIRLRRRYAAPMGAFCLGGLTAAALVFPQDPWEGFLRENHVSKFARSGITSVSEFLTHGFMESDASIAERLGTPLVQTACTSVHPSGRRPHIILIHDESSFDIRQAPGIKVPQNYGGHFKSFDGKARQFIVEGNGGPSWLTEYNVLAGLSSRSFGRFSYFVTRIATGRVERGLPLALKNCGYQTLSLYPAQGAFMGARGFQTTAGIDKFYDAKALGTRSIEPDRFFYDAAARLMSQQTPRQPMFAFVYLAANHFPWTTRFRPDLAPDWRDLGNAPKVDEYLRRQAMSVQDYTNFVARLKRDFPGEPFLIVRFGDHQPEFSTQILDPLLTEQDVSQRLMNYDRRYYTTYYAIDAINFRPSMTPAVMDTIDAAYLPLVVQEAAGISLDPSFVEQKKIMLRCKGLFYACNGGGEARRFNRLLIDAGLIRNL